MAVLFVIDFYNIDNQDALVVNPNDSDITQARHKIYENLGNHESHLLRVRLNSKALFSRFKDFEGLIGVLPTQSLIPRLILANTLSEELPDWLSNEFIVKLGFLNMPLDSISNASLLDKLIHVCGESLLAKDFSSFIYDLTNQSDSFFELFKIEEVQKRFKVHFQFEFQWSEEVADLFIVSLMSSSSINAFLTLLAYEQHQDLLRKIIGQYHFTLPLPARALPVQLLDIPTLPLLESNANELPSKLLKILDELVRKIERGDFEPDVLADLVISPWTSVLVEIKMRTDKDCKFITPKLVEKLISFNDDTANELASELSKQLDLQFYKGLPESATIEEVFTWLPGYFDSVRQSFTSNQEPTEDLNLSFTHWILKQSARISRSDYDWGQLSKRVDRYLEQDYLVVIYMVDALSALNQDILDEAVLKIDQLDIRKELLFAPLPTLTEVGKMAVLTGSDACKLANDQETALRERYKDYLPEQNSLKVIRSWKAANEHIDKETNLLVYFENRIDERLHDGSDFSKHRKDVSIILGQMAEAINRWKKDAGYANREVVFFITADHGMTVVRNQYQGIPVGEVKERVFKVSEVPANDNADFSYIKKGNNGSGYLVPKKRLGLSKNAMLTHGGLTPEEVLIPFITLTSKLPATLDTPLVFRVLDEKCLRINEKSWQIGVELRAKVTLNNIRIKFNKPFSAYELIDTIRENKTQKVLINFSSTYEQCGLTELEITLSYEREGANEFNTKQFSCVFPEPLIQKDADTQGFEDMFN